MSALGEQDFGDWVGLTHDEIAAHDPAAAARFWDDPANRAPPGGEAFTDVLARVAAAIEALGRAHAGRDLVVVAHAGTIRAALALALGLTPQFALRVVIAPLSTTRLDRVGDSWRVEGVNLPAPITALAGATDPG